MTDDELKEFALASVDFGLRDPRDKCWSGTDQGPMRYNDRLLAQAAATVATEMFGRLIRFDVLPGSPFRVKDTVNPRYTGEEAITRIERWV